MVKILWSSHRFWWNHIKYSKWCWGGENFIFWGPITYRESEGEPIYTFLEESCLRWWLDIKIRSELAKILLTKYKVKAVYIETFPMLLMWEHVCTCFYLSYVKYFLVGLTVNLVTEVVPCAISKWSSCIWA